MPPAPCFSRVVGGGINRKRFRWRVGLFGGNCLGFIGCGILAVIFRFTGYPLPPLVIGFILGGMMEDNVGRAIRKAGGMEFMWERSMTLALLIFAFVLVAAPFWFDRVKKRRATS